MYFIIAINWAVAVIRMVLLRSIFIIFITNSYRLFQWDCFFLISIFCQGTTFEVFF